MARDGFACCTGQWRGSAAEEKSEKYAHVRIDRLGGGDIVDSGSRRILRQLLAMVGTKRLGSTIRAMKLPQ